MADKTNKSNALPLARAFRLKELPGLIGKRIEIPAGRLGVAIYADGKAQTFPPGQHRLLSAFARLRGRGTGLQAGYVPSGDFAAHLKCEYLLSGRGELLDVSLVFSLELADPVRFFKEVTLPQGEVRASGVEIDPQIVRAALGKITQKYEAADLIHGLLDARAAAELQSSLHAVLGNQGLRLKEVVLLSFTRAENRALVAEKTQALDERLQDVETQAKMAQIENQAQLNEFIQQVDPELDGVTHFQLGSDEKGKGSLKGKVADALRSWFTIETSKEGGRRRWRIEGLLRRKRDAEEGPARPKIRRPPQGWWLPRTVWMIFVILAGLMLTGTLNWIARAASWDNRLEVLLVIWGFVIGVVLESVKALYEKREAFAEATWMLPGYQRLDDLVGNDRAWADELVRQQCNRELRHVREVVTDIRSREFKREKIELALKLKNEVERNAEECAERVSRPDYGRPPYVTDLRISRHAWGHMLDNDEDLLLYANALSDKAHLLQQRSHAGGMTVEMVADLDAEILKFCNRFFERSRPLQMPAEETR